MVDSPTIKAPIKGKPGPGPERQLVSMLTSTHTGSGHGVEVGRGVPVAGKAVLLATGTAFVPGSVSTAVRKASKVLAAILSIALEVCVAARSSGGTNTRPQALSNATPASSKKFSLDFVMLIT